MTRVEVICNDTQSTSAKGKLLENFASEFLKIQNFSVESEVRVTAAEIDLLCKSNINGKIIYVECKAYRNTISADVPKKLLGTISLEEYSEGWLLTTGELGKDAKGFVDKWNQKPANEREKLSFYTPDLVITTFINSGLIVDPKHISNELIKKIENKIGNWTLMISTFGKFWVLECLEGGLPVGLLGFYAKNGDLITENELLINLSKTDTSLKDLDFLYFQKINKADTRADLEKVSMQVIPVQQGESWVDYRPARPQDFVGRTEDQKNILDFLKSVAENKTSSRVFAITGNSGMGKSSLIAKLRERVNNGYFKKKYFIYAIDVRAAKDHNYINSALIKSFTEANVAGFIKSNDVIITDYQNPFSSDAIQIILNELKKQNRILCIVFDQFEELYSKPELFSIFEKVKELLLNVTSLQENIVLGFAWKTDSTVYQDHPAYHFWHSLKDQRYTISLTPFSKGDCERVLSIFEKQINETIPKNLKHQLISQAQGYPWLLKKLCIHIYNKLKENESITSLLDGNLDIKLLFDLDLQELSPPELACLRLIAQQAPVDWFEIVELTDSKIIQNLIEKRLVIRSGERLIIYWDIFREYLLTNKVPNLPFNYLPVSPSLNRFLMATKKINSKTFTNYKDLAEKIGVSEGTSQNIVSDLFMLRVATGRHDSFKLVNGIDNSNNNEILNYLRNIFKDHIAVKELKTLKDGSVITTDDLIGILKKYNPIAQHNYSTWKLYSKKIGVWLSSLGFVTETDEKNLINTEHDIIADTNAFTNNRFGHGFTQFTTSPKKIINLYNLISDQSRTENWIKDNSLRNASLILKKFSLVICSDGLFTINGESSSNNIVDLLQEKFMKEESYKQLLEIQNKGILLDPQNISSYISDKYNLKWSDSTLKRVGNSLLLWHKWLNEEST